MPLMQIKHRFTGEVIFQGDYATFRAMVEAAVGSRANLSRANLSGAYLSGAYLSGAYLSGADLSRANGISRHLVTPLAMLLDQPGDIRAYKLVTAEGDSPIAPYNGHKAIRYVVGKSYRLKKGDCNTDEFEQCGAGINLATLDWCMKEWTPGRRILIAEFTAKDIASIPTATDGKFRVFRCKIVGEKNLEEIGLVKPVKQTQGAK